MEGFQASQIETRDDLVVIGKQVIKEAFRSKHAFDIQETMNQMFGAYYCGLEKAFEMGLIAAHHDEYNMIDRYVFLKSAPPSPQVYIREFIELGAETSSRILSEAKKLGLENV